MSFQSIERAVAWPPRIFWPLLGLGIVLAADGATALVFHTTAAWASTHSLTLYLAAPLAALLVGIPAWLHFIVKPRQVTIKRGLLLGIVCSVIAHPVMWMLLFLSAPFLPSTALSLSFSLLLFEVIYSLIYGGWATTLIAALTGTLLILLQRTLTRAQQQRVSQVAQASLWRELSSAKIGQAEAGREDVCL